MIEPDEKMPQPKPNFFHERGPSGQPELKMKFTDYYWLEYLLSPEKLDKIFTMHDNYLAGLESKDESMGENGNISTGSKRKFSLSSHQSKSIRLEPTLSYNPWMIAKELFNRSNRRTLPQNANTNTNVPTTGPTGQLQLLTDQLQNSNDESSNDNLTEQKKDDMKKLALYIISNYRYDLSQIIKYFTPDEQRGVIGLILKFCGTYSNDVDIGNFMDVPMPKETCDEENSEKKDLPSEQEQERTETAMKDNNKSANQSTPEPEKRDKNATTEQHFKDSILFAVISHRRWELSTIISDAIPKRLPGATVPSGSSQAAQISASPEEKDRLELVAEHKINAEEAVQYLEKAVLMALGGRKELVVPLFTPEKLAAGTGRPSTLSIPVEEILATISLDLANYFYFDKSTSNNREKALFYYDTCIRNLKLDVSITTNNFLNSKWTKYFQISNIQNAINFVEERIKIVKSVISPGQGVLADSSKSRAFQHLSNKNFEELIILLATDISKQEISRVYKKFILGKLRVGVAENFRKKFPKKIFFSTIFHDFYPYKFIHFTPSPTTLHSYHSTKTNSTPHSSSPPLSNSLNKN